MKQLLSVVLGVVLVCAVAGSVVNGTMAGFFDTEVSTENRMHAGSLNLTVDDQDDEAGDIIQPWHIQLTPDKPYEREVILCNTGTLPGIAYIHISEVLGEEDVPGVGSATTEPELAAEEGVTPVGRDEDGNPVYATNDGTATGTPLLGFDTANLDDYILVTMWWGGQPVELDSGQYTLPLSQISCQTIELGEVSGDTFLPGSGWGSYFEYNTANGTVVKPLIAAQEFTIGTVTVSYDDALSQLHVVYETEGGWTMTTTHVYADPLNPPTAGKKDWYKHENLGGVTSNEYIISIGSGTLFIAAHADVVDPNGGGETAYAKGKCHKLKLRFLFPDIDEDDLDFHLFDETIHEEAKWDHWPTNAYQGDYCTFNIEYTLQGDCPRGRRR